MERQELQNRRAVNQIWNGAGRYDVQPEQAAFDEGGDPELYMNTVMGLARRDYDFARFQPMLHAFQQQPQGGLYGDIFWLGLEHAVYEKEAPRRPALEALRRQQVQSHVTQRENGTYTVTLKLRDDVDSLMELELMVADKESGQALAERFQREPEKVYGQIIGLLCRK